MGAGGFEQMPGTGADAYQMMDPSGYTGQAAANLFGGPAQSMMNRGMGAMGAWGADASDPNSFMSQYLNDFSGLQGAVTEATSPLNEQLQRQMQQNIAQGMSQAGGQLSGLGALRSSAMGEAAGDVVGRAATGASADLARQQLGMLGQMGNQAMGQRGAALGQQMQMPGQLMGMQAQFGAPNYVAPQYYQKPGALDWISSIGSIAGGAGGMLTGLGAL